MKCSIPRDIYEILVDGEPIKFEQDDQVQTIFMMLMNGKYTGGGMIVDPFACMNDGLIDILIVTDENEMKFKRIVKIMDEAKKKGGIHAYGNHTFLRGKKIEVTYKGRSGKNSNQQ